MYESFFGFKDTPFRLSADERFRYAHHNYLRASAYLAYALEQGEGFVMITGQPGSGKTTLIRDILAEIDVSKILAINLVTSQLQAEELLRKVALEYGLPAQTYDKATLLTSIHNHIVDLHQKGMRSILFLDEAQNLSVSGLEELRLLSNLQAGRHSLLQIVLIGHDELRGLVLGPGMEHFQQRLIATCQIEPMTVEQAKGYVTHRLGLVGWNNDPSFQQQVFPLLHLATQGVPRKINHLMSRLLLFAALENKHLLGDEDVLVVIRELVDEYRLTLRNAESYEAFEERYREERIVTGQADDASEVITDQCEGDESLALDSDDALDIPDTDWLSWSDEAQGDGETALPPVRSDLQQTYTAAVDGIDDPNQDWREMESADIHPSIDWDDSGSGPVSEADGSDEDEHQWGGVWWMSRGDDRRSSSPMVIPPNSENGSRERSFSWSEITGASRSHLHGNLSLPSVWVEGCPDIPNARLPAAPSNNESNGQKGRLKRSLLRLFYLLLFGVSVLLFVQFLPSGSQWHWQGIKGYLIERLNSDRLSKTATLMGRGIEAEDGYAMHLNDVDRVMREREIDDEDIAIVPEIIELARRYYIFFEFNRVDIPTEYLPLLHAILKKIAAEEMTFLKITGFADSYGNRKYNDRLSLRRAERVSRFFKEQGIAGSRLHVEGVGPEEVEALSEDTIIKPSDEGRRVELMIFPQK
ncbi:MAG: AAA family ATPase [Candidatus Thiodiazotropha sp. (ex Dulcina madagascariensis)]|nr:AAA family ATPase [Candidatus Thiodiazotropha sp. (ex Dulcina madagascariensis)]